MADDFKTEVAEATKELKKLDTVLAGVVSRLTQTSSAIHAANGSSQSSGGGTATTGSSMMPNSLANVPGQQPMGRASSGLTNMLLGAAPGLIQAGQSVMTGALAMMPDVGPTVNRATNYYNSSVRFGLGAGGDARVQSATYNAMRGGVTSPTSDAEVAQYLSAQGMNFSTNPGSLYMQTVRGVSNAAKYLNMSNDRAAAALNGLTTGSMSASLMRNMGIYTTDPVTGATKSQGQIFAEMRSRLQAGHKQASVTDTNKFFRQLGGQEMLTSMGFSNDQSQLFQQYMLEAAKGNNLDLTSDKAMQDFAKKNGINPAKAQLESNTYAAGAMNDAQANYIKAINDSLPALKSLNETAGKLAQTFAGYAKAQISFFQGNTAGAGFVQGASGVGGGVMNAVGGAIGAGMLMRGMGGGGGTAPGGNAGKYLSAAGKVARGGLGVAGAVMTTMNIINQADQAGQIGLQQKAMKATRSQADQAATGQAWSSALQNGLGGAASGAMIGSMFAPGIGTAIGAVAGGLIGGVGGWFSSYNAAMQGAGYGGESSTISNSGVTGNSKTNIKFNPPVNAKITDDFGPRPSPFHNGTNTYHHGIDFGAGMGTPIQASADGTVIFTGPSGDYGNLVKIKHANGMVTYYAHQSRIACTNGKEVKQGQVIGYVGSTGNSTGAHLHFGVTDAAGNFFDPAKILTGIAGKVINGSGTGASSGGTIYGGGGTAAPDINSIIDSRAKTGAISVPAYNGAGSAGAGSSSSSVVGASGNMGVGVGTSGVNSLTNKNMGIYLPGAPRAKDGDSNVANDGPVNVHAGEAILTAEQAKVWREGIAAGGGRGGGNNVTINLSIAQASETEARRFAELVKNYIEADSLIHKMGSK
jgi:murein DD-endopeptidase MepM/ murein hydrolase activator NlpD